MQMPSMQSSPGKHVWQVRLPSFQQEIFSGSKNEHSSPSLAQGRQVPSSPQ